MVELKQAVAIFHFTEKIKSDLIMVFSLLEVLNTIEEGQIEGAEKLLQTYLNSLINEVNIAANATKVQGFNDVNAKLQEALEQIKKHSYANLTRIVSEAISLTTTNGSTAAETLKEKDLI
jgi:flagellin-specific chaperone FliS